MSSRLRNTLDRITDMDLTAILDGIRRGRTDLIFELLALDDWRSALARGSVRPAQWLVYYGDLTALRALVRAGDDLSSLVLDDELNHAAFFGHWHVCDFLIERGADPRCCVASTGETPLHNALAKAGRPYYRHTVQLLLERGADPNATTIPGAESDGFMRDVRTCGETPLHRAAAYADRATIDLLLEHGADVTARDAHGDSPLSWASRHLRPGRILAALAFGEHRISARTEERMTSDHGAGWGDGMDWKLFGDYLPERALRGATR